MCDENLRFSHGRNTRFIFTPNKHVGLEDNQINNIKEIFCIFMELYPKIKIDIIGDAYTYHLINIQNNRTFYDFLLSHDQLLAKPLWNVEDRLYSYIKRNDYASYNNDIDILNLKHVNFIVFNQESIHKSRFSDLHLESFKQYNFTPNYYGVGEYELKRIKQAERLRAIPRLVYHEFAHAIEHQYNMGNNENMLALYNKYGFLYDEFKFKDIHEFIAECYLTSVIVDNNDIANKVRSCMDDIISSV